MGIMDFLKGAGNFMTTSFDANRMNLGQMNPLQSLAGIAALAALAKKHPGTSAVLLGGTLGLNKRARQQREMDKINRILGLPLGTTNPLDQFQAMTAKNQFDAFNRKQEQDTSYAEALSSVYDPENRDIYSSPTFKSLLRSGPQGGADVIGTLPSMGGANLLSLIKNTRPTTRRTGDYIDTTDPVTGKTKSVLSSLGLAKQGAYEASAGRNRSGDKYAPELKEWRKPNALPIYVDMNKPSDVILAQQGGYKQYAERDAFKEDAVRTRIVASFNADPAVRKVEQMDEFSNLIQDIAASDNPIGQSSLQTLMARASGEVGNLSEADKKPFGGSKALNARIAQTFKELYTGKKTPENLQFISQLAETFKRTGARKKRSLARERAKQYSKANKEMGFNEQDIYEMLSPDLGNYDSPKQNDPVDEYNSLAEELRQLKAMEK